MRLLTRWPSTRWLVRRSSVEPAVPSHRRRALRRLVFWSGCSHLVLALVVWLAVRIASDRWWPATLLMFGPRWPLALPLFVLVPASFLVRAGRATMLVSTAVVLFGVLGLRAPRRPWPAGGSRTASLCVITCNIHRRQVDASALRGLIDSSGADVVAIQEWTSRHEAELFADGSGGVGGWFLRREGDELLLASRFPIRRVTNLSTGAWLGPGAAAAYELQTPHGSVNFINLHLASPHRSFEDVIDGDDDAASAVQANSATRLRQSEDVASAARRLGPLTVIAGDFNTPDESPIFRRCWRDFPDAFGEAGWGFGNTYYARWTAVRIDHVLLGAGWRCRRCWAGPAVGSPHRPVLAQLELVAGPIAAKAN